MRLKIVAWPSVVSCNILSRIGLGITQHLRFAKRVGELRARLHLAQDEVAGPVQMPSMQRHWSPASPCCNPGMTRIPQLPPLHKAAGRPAARQRLQLHSMRGDQLLVRGDDRLPCLQRAPYPLARGSRPPANSTTMSTSEPRTRSASSDHSTGQVSQSTRLRAIAAVKDMRQLQSRRAAGRKETAPPSCQPCRSPGWRPSGPVRGIN